jgi:hypothetical protein
MPSTSRPSAHAHSLVHQTTVEMAHELYDTMMSDNAWYDLWKSQNPGLTPRGLADRFVARNLSKLLPQARAVLAGMLGNPMTDPATKDQIYAALTLDNTLLRGRGNAGLGPGNGALH